MMNKLNLFFVIYILSATVFFTPLARAQETKVSHGFGGIDYVFTRDTSNPALGEAWRDPDGMIWGDIPKKGNVTRDSEGILHYQMDHYQAAAYCKSIHAQLPSKEDFMRLRMYMGADRDDNRYDETEYKPQVLPSLYYMVHDIFTGKLILITNDFWSSSILSPAYSYIVWAQKGRNGYIGQYYRIETISVRCVVPKR